MKPNPEKFRVAPGRASRLSKCPTATKPLYKSKSHYRKMRARQIDQLSALQSLLYAHDRYAFLLIFQAMDAAGKDSAIKHVMSGVNPQGCEVYIFKHPSAEELAHDSLWRTTRCLSLARTDRHLQPLLLRGSAHRASPSRYPVQRSFADRIRRTLANEKA